MTLIFFWDKNIFQSIFHLIIAFRNSKILQSFQLKIMSMEGSWCEQVLSTRDPFHHSLQDAVPDSHLVDCIFCLDGFVLSAQPLNHNKLDIPRDFRRMFSKRRFLDSDIELSYKPKPSNSQGIPLFNVLHCLILQFCIHSCWFTIESIINNCSLHFDTNN